MINLKNLFRLIATILVVVAAIAIVIVAAYKVLQA
jgi:hypothetical protein